MSEKQEETASAKTRNIESKIDVNAIMNTTVFASDFLLAEYKTLRDEIIKKMDHRTAMVVCSITVSSAVLGFGIDRRSGALLLVSPMVSLLLGILVLFHNVQIGETSEHIRTQIERPMLKNFQNLHGWHQVKSDPKYRLKQRMFPYHLPLILIAIASAFVAFPLAFSLADRMIVVLPLFIVDVTLLVVYGVQLVKHRSLV